MEDVVEVYSDSSCSDDDDSQSLNFTIHHNNNGSFAEHTVLSSQQVYALMESEMKKVRDVVPDVNNA